MSDFYQLDDAGQAACMAALGEIALTRWGISEAKLDLIKYRENAVFRAQLPDATCYALRIHRAGYHSDDELRSELQWMAALAESGIEVPTLVPSQDGEPFQVVQGGDVPEPRQIDLFEWIEGEQLGSAEEGVVEVETIQATYHMIGQLAAKLHNQATSWTLPPGFTRHAWDTDGLVGAQPFWGPFWELQALSDEQRDLIGEARERVQQDMQAYAADPANADRYSMIHADFVAENLMVDQGRVRLIDFDDAGFGWHLFELATALYFETEADYYEDAYQALIAGYREFRDLPDRQLAQLPLFMLARSFTYLGWVHTRFETQTAKELTPMLVGKACAVAREYLGKT
ncbi:MAG: phosphotransferase [Pseudomonadota bacterium]